jgi:signal transduction histidine kinase
MYDASFDALRTGFTAAVSHELRTPLARILALLDSTDLPGATSTPCSSRPAPRSSTPAR